MPPKSSKQRPLTASAGNKDMATMRSLLGEYMAYKDGNGVYANPFVNRR